MLFEDASKEGMAPVGVTIIGAGKPRKAFARDIGFNKTTTTSPSRLQCHLGTRPP
jgi:hypothetical protein